MNITDNIFRGKVAVVTGSSGFVGQHLVKALAEVGAKILELDIKTGIDLTDWKKLSKIDPFDLMFHLGAKTFVPDSYKNPGTFYYTNIACTINALDLCRLHEAKIVYASSYLYGKPHYLPVDEKHPVSAFNPYASTKLIGERLCRDYHRHFGVKVVILRPFNIYGPRQDERFLIPKMLKQASSGIIKLEDPLPKRDFVYVSDVIDAYLKAAAYNHEDFSIFNIGYGKSYSVKEIVSIVQGLYGDKPRVKFAMKRRHCEIMDTVACIKKASKVLGWEPKTDLSVGLQSMISKLVSHEETLPT